MITPTKDNSIPPLATQDRMQIVFKDLRYSVNVSSKETIPGKRGPFKTKTVVKEKVILHNVSGYFREGRLTAVMGASGAGKTSLLQVLAGEVRAGDVSGTISVNGQPISGEQIKSISGFVFQDDVILATMTVREAIAMSATLRLPQTLSQTERDDRVNAMLRLLNLEKCANTIIGSATLKGISGGERKRCAIAMELITNPAVLFLDEPTSGLDSFTAYSAISILKKLAHDGGRTVVATIHQPSSEIFHLFDDLLLLADGRVIYHGEIEKAVDYFGSLGYVCPTYVNPSDFIFMSILNNEEGNNSDPYGARKDVSETNRERISRLLNVWAESSQQKEVMKVVDYPREGGITQNVLKQVSTFITQFKYLYQRASKNAVRNPMIIRAKLGQTLVFGLVIGLLFLNTQDKVGYVAFQNRTGVLFFLAVNNVMSSAFGILSIFGQEKSVFSREFGAGYYGLGAYFLSKVGVEAPFFVIFPWLQATITYWMVGLQQDAAKYFILCSIVVLCAVSGFALGIFFACVFNSLEMALAITPVVLLPLMLFSGLFINQNAIPVFPTGSSGYLQSVTVSKAWPKTNSMVLYTKVTLLTQ